MYLTIICSVGEDEKRNDSIILFRHRRKCIKNPRKRSCLLDPNILASEIYPKEMIISGHKLFHKVVHNGIVHTIKIENSV